MGLFASLMGNQQQPGMTYPGAGMPNTQIAPGAMPNIPGAPQIGIAPPAQGQPQNRPMNTPQPNFNGSGATATPTSAVSSTAGGAQNGMFQGMAQNPMLMMALLKSRGSGSAPDLTSMFNPADATAGLTASPMAGTGSALAGQFAFDPAATASLAPLGFGAGMSAGGAAAGLGGGAADAALAGAGADAAAASLGTGAALSPEMLAAMGFML
jgi:hypothetical protein